MLLNLTHKQILTDVVSYRFDLVLSVGTCGNRLQSQTRFVRPILPVYHVNFHLTLEMLLSFYYNSPHHCCREELTCILLAVILLEAMTYIYSVSYQYFYQHLRFISRVNCGDF